MNRSSKFALIGCGVLLVLAGCVPREVASFSPTRSDWLQADTGAADAADEVINPDILPRTHFAAGQLFEQQGEIRRAIIQYRKAIFEASDYVPAYNRLGVLLGRLGRHPEAEQALKKAVEIRPDWAFLRNNLAFEYMLQERWNDAEAELRNALQLKPDFVRAHNNLAMVLFKMGCFEESLVEFLQAVPEVDAYYNIGLMFRGARRYRDAASAFEHALSLSPQFEAAKIQLARIAPHLEQETVLEPTTDWEQWETSAPADPQLQHAETDVPPRAMAEETGLATAGELLDHQAPDDAAPVEEENRTATTRTESSEYRAVVSAEVPESLPTEIKVAVVDDPAGNQSPDELPDEEDGAVTIPTDSSEDRVVASAEAPNAFAAEASVAVGDDHFDDYASDDEPPIDEDCMDAIWDDWSDDDTLVSAEVPEAVAAEMSLAVADASFDVQAPVNGPPIDEDCTDWDDWSSDDTLVSAEAPEAVAAEMSLAVADDRFDDYASDDEPPIDEDCTDWDDWSSDDTLVSAEAPEAVAAEMSLAVATAAEPGEARSTNLDGEPDTLEIQGVALRSQDVDPRELGDAVATVWVASAPPVHPMELTGGWMSGVMPVNGSPEDLLDQVVYLFPEHPLTGLRSRISRAKVRCARPARGPAPREFGELFSETNPYPMPPFDR